MKNIIYQSINYLLGIPLFALVIGSGCSADYSSEAAPNTNGAGGSTARFSINGDHLYAVSNTSLKVFDISEPANPVAGNTIKLGVGVETIFHYGDHLFIGSQTGMYIYDNSNPANPRFLSQYEHVQSCDPVVVQGNYAYITLRNGNTCRNGQNLLDVVDISNILTPAIVRSYPMQNPHGLGIDGNTLFVCEGDFGLKVLDTTLPDSVTLINHIEGIRTFDVIPRNKLLFVVGKDGLLQYDYSNPSELELLSQLPIAF